MSVEHVPVVVIGGAGPTGITVATLLAQYGIDCVILDRWAQVYPQPRAVHLDDEICRIVARLGLADGFAAISRPAHGLRLLDGSMNVLAEFNRDTALSGNGFPQANMFDQPEFETLLRANLERYPRARLRGGVEVTEVTDAKPDRVRVTYTDRSDGTEHRVDADYVLGCDGANSITRRRIGSRMHDLGFEQRWLVVDVATSADIDQWRASTRSATRSAPPPTCASARPATGGSSSCCSPNPQATTPPSTRCCRCFVRGSTRCPRTT